jgi:hypothetical protein
VLGSILFVPKLLVVNFLISLNFILKIYFLLLSFINERSSFFKSLILYSIEVPELLVVLFLLILPYILLYETVLEVFFMISLDFILLSLLKISLVGGRLIKLLNKSGLFLHSCSLCSHIPLLGLFDSLVLRLMNILLELLVSLLLIGDVFVILIIHEVLELTIFGLGFKLEILQKA